MNNSFHYSSIPIFQTDSRISVVKSYLITMRPYLMFVSGITGITGISFSGNTNLLQAILIFIASFLSYGFGQALTDCFQIDTDSISSPYRPLTQGKISKTMVLSISAAGLTFCISIFTFYNPINLILGILAGLGLGTYTYFKRRWWGGPFYNSWIVVGLFIMAFLAAGEKTLSSEIILTAVTVFFGYSNFVLSGYFKDINADMITGYNTLPVKFGRKVSTVVSDIFALLMLIFASVIIYKNSSKLIFVIPSFMFFITGLSFGLIAQLRLHKVHSDEDAHKAISPVVHSYILILSGVVLSNKPDWLLPLIIFYLGFLLILKLRPSKQQI